jgi:hypothetical protein
MWFVSCNFKKTAHKIRDMPVRIKRRRKSRQAVNQKLKVTEAAKFFFNHPLFFFAEFRRTRFFAPQACVDS